MSIDFEKDEYFALVKTIADSDQRLLTVKSWGVTLSLVALGLGFQYRAYGFFIIAAISSLAFWVVEHASRRHQMRHYVRMRQIEFNNFLRELEANRPQSAPRIDWSWHIAKDILEGKASAQQDGEIETKQKNIWFSHAWAMPHVALPHVLTLVVSAFLVYQGYNGDLIGFTLGTPPSPK
ncbi:hypothetical protein [Azohydromonas aeria]|uniref:hypothetical protein n=1 Tax=Azohydromonas aeria TaxID=2590212 RepID=UPI0012F7B38A|nr:hypothetical protein [Azohydromonas aeria]